MTLQDDQWDLDHFRKHVQLAAELEAWTIPYYMSSMFSISILFGMIGPFLRQG